MHSYDLEVIIWKSPQLFPTHHTHLLLIFTQIVVIFGNRKEGWCGKKCRSTLQHLVHLLLEVIIELLNSFTMGKKVSNCSMDFVFRASQIFPLMNCMNLFRLEKMENVIHWVPLCIQVNKYVSLKIYFVCRIGG